jgi:ankyrin repeat protein
LFAVAQGIVKNDPEAIRTAAKNVPDLQAAGRDGATLLNFAVRQSWRRPESVEAIKTLLSVGADPNYTNGNRNSLAMADAGHSSARVLRSMLEAGGNANTRDGFNQPMILMNWYLGYYQDQARSRFELLLDHGADVNSAMPADRSDYAGYPLLLYRTAMGLNDDLAYADALLLLQRA